MDVAVTSNRVLRPDGSFESDTLHFSGAAIVTGARGVAVRWDMGDHLVLPGIVDLHGDAFERQIMPRPGVVFPVDLAFVDTDRQMVAAGITTAFHGITYSWEPGLRGADMVRRILAGLDSVRDRLACDTRVHLRWETYNLDAVDEIIDWIETGRVDALAFNDHLPMISAKARDPEKLAQYADRAGLPLESFATLLRYVAAREGEVDSAVGRLASAARAVDLPMLSHDDETPGMRRRYHELGSRIAEFPCNRETAEYSVGLDDPVVLGAPNVLRGGSHCNRLDAAEATAHGLCQILTSDYYYPSLLMAPFRLAQRGVPFGDAWDMVSKNPADAAGLGNRGTLTPGKRADAVVIDDTDPSLPVVVATFVAGRPVYMADALQGLYPDALGAVA
jgi:alpha-D-ribose 1-methylphosphonate 5-triphosphate diphosphatase